MSTTVTVIGVAFIMASMAGIGLQVSLGKLRTALRVRGFLGRALVANFVLIPAVGVGLARLVVTMGSASASAFVLLACAAGGPSALQFTSKARGALTYAGEMGFVLSLLAVLFSPLLMSLALPAGTSLVVPYARTFKRSSGSVKVSPVSTMSQRRWLPCWRSPFTNSPHFVQ